MASAGPFPVQPADELHRIILTAILNRIVLRAVYDGGIRLLCPHILGRNRDGKVRILCLQLDGFSASGLQRNDDPGDWRCLALEKFQAIAYDASPWKTAPNCGGLPKCMAEIELTAQLDPHPQKGQ